MTGKKTVIDMINRHSKLVQNEDKTRLDSVEKNNPMRIVRKIKKIDNPRMKI